MSRRSFGAITRLPSKRYRARYTGLDTRWHNAPTTFEAKIDAEAWLVQERRLIDGGGWTWTFALSRWVRRLLPLSVNMV